MAYYKGKATSAVALDNIKKELTGKKGYQAGCLAYYKSFAILYGSVSILLAKRSSSVFILRRSVDKEETLSLTD